MRTRGTLRVVAGLLLGAGIWLALRSAARDDALSPDARPALAAPDHRSPDALPLAPAAAPPAADAARPVAGSAQPEDVAPPDKRGHVLRLRLVGLRADVLGAPRVSVIGRGVPMESARSVWHVTPTQTDDPEVVETAISELFAGGAEPTALEIRVDHPGYLPTTAHTSTTGSKPERSNAPVIYAATVELTRAAIIVGLVTTGDGAPIADALVAAVEWRAEGPEDQSEGAALTDSQGRYAVRVGRSADWLVIAVAKGLLPAGVRVVAAPPDTVDAPPIRLVPGVEIAGTISFAGGRPGLAHGGRRAGLDVGAEPLGGAGVTIELRLEGKRYESVRWLDGRVGPVGGDATPDDRGRYRIAGLVPGPHRVRVSEGSFSTGRFAHDTFTELTREVVAPASGVDFVVAAVHVQVTVRADGSLLAGAMVNLGNARGGTGSGTLADGRIDFEALPGVEYTLRITAPGFAAHTETFTAPPVGEGLRREVDLARLAAAGPVEVRFVGDGASDLRVAGWTVRKAPKGSGERDGDAPVVDGRCSIGGLAPGPFELVVSPGRAGNEATGFWMDQVVAGDGAAGRETRVDVSLVRGGRLRIVCRAPDDEILGVNVELLQGTQALEGCVYRTDTENGWTTMLNHTSPKRPSDLLRVLEPGSYRVTLSLDGFETIERPIIIAPGELTTVDVTLQKR